MSIHELMASGEPRESRGLHEQIRQDAAVYARPQHLQERVQSVHELTGRPEPRIGRGILAVAMFAIGAVKLMSPDATAETPQASPAPIEQPAYAPRSVEQKQSAIVSAAKGYLEMGIRETSPNHSPEIDEFFQMGLKGRNAEWCASFGSRVWHDGGISMSGGSLDGYKGPDWQLEYVNRVTQWVDQNGGMVFDRSTLLLPSFEPKPGDMIVYNRDGKLFDGRPGKNHIGVVTEYSRETGKVTTIEGNFDDAVSQRVLDLKSPQKSGTKYIAGILRHPELITKEPKPLTQEAESIISGLKLPEEKKNFLRTMVPAVVTAYQEIPVTNPIATLAQATLESGWGQSKLATEANNYFGVKAGKKWTGPTVTKPTKEQDAAGNERTIQDAFRAYNAPIESLYDHVRMISSRPHYQDGARNNNDVRNYVRGLFHEIDGQGNIIKRQGEPGVLSYGTALNYEESVVDVANSFQYADLIAAQSS